MSKNHNLKALTSLALLSTPILSNDYLSTFLPFVATLILKKKYQEVKIKDIVSDFKDEYGLYIPRAPMQAILSKAVKNELIEKREDGRFYPITENLTKNSFIYKEQDEKKTIDIILQRFMDFAKEKFEKKFDKQKAGECFIDFWDEYSPKSISINETNIEDIYHQDSNKQDIYLVAAFISHIEKTDYGLFEVLKKLSFAYLIVIAMSFDEPVESRIDALSNLTIYLDTNIIFRLMGLETDELRDAYIEMFEMYKKAISPKFMVFRHTMEEMLGILEDCGKWINHPEYDPKLANSALLSFRKKQYTKVQINLFINNFERKLNEYGIFVDDNAYYDIAYNTKQIDEDEFKTNLIEKYKEKNPLYDPVKSDRTLNYDIQSITNIVKLWGKKSSRTYSRLGYLFLTSNAALAFVCRRFSDSYWWDNKKHKSPCITDYYLGTMIWLNTPMETMQKVSKLKLLADCSAAMTLSKGVLDKFLLELERLKKAQVINSEDYLLLRNEGYQTNYLQEMTLNDETAFNDEIPELILRKIKDDIARPYIEEIERKTKEINRAIIEKQQKEKELKTIYDNQRISDEYYDKRIEDYRNQAEKYTNYLESFILPVMSVLFGIVSWRCGQMGYSNSSMFFKLTTVLLAVCIGMMKCNAYYVHDKISNLLKIIMEKYYDIKMILIK